MAARDYSEDAMSSHYSYISANSRQFNGINNNNIANPAATVNHDSMTTSKFVANNYNLSQSHQSRDSGGAHSIEYPKSIGRRSQEVVET